MSEPRAPETERESRWGALLAVAAIIGITVFTFGADLLMSDQPPPPDPPRELPSLRGEETPAAIFDASARLTVIRFWSATCASCEDEIAGTNALAEAFPEVRFIATSVDEDRSAGTVWASALDPPVLAVSDSGRMLAQAMEVSAVPATVIVDRNRAVARRFHAVDNATLRSALATLTDEPRSVVRQRVGLRSGGR